MIFEVQSGENLAAIIKAFPDAKIRALVTRPPCDCWRVEISDDFPRTCPHCGGGLTEAGKLPEDGTRGFISPEEDDPRPIHEPPPESVVDLGSAGSPAVEDFGTLGTAEETPRERMMKKGKKKTPRKSRKKKKG